MTMHTGTTISDLERMVLQAEVMADFTELARTYPEMFGPCQCGNIKLNCDCHPRDEREELYEPRERQR